MPLLHDRTHRQTSPKSPGRFENEAPSILRNTLCPNHVRSICETEFQDLGSSPSSGSRSSSDTIGPSTKPNTFRPIAKSCAPIECVRFAKRIATMPTRTFEPIANHVEHDRSSSNPTSLRSSAKPYGSIACARFAKRNPGTLPGKFGSWRRNIDRQGDSEYGGSALGFGCLVHDSIDQPCSCRIKANGPQRSDPDFRQIAALSMDPSIA